MPGGRKAVGEGEEEEWDSVNYSKRQNVERLYYLSIANVMTILLISQIEIHELGLNPHLVTSSTADLSLFAFVWAFITELEDIVIAYDIIGWIIITIP